jgi:hypothetical protein
MGIGLLGRVGLSLPRWRLLVFLHWRFRGSHLSLLSLWNK